MMFVFFGRFAPHSHHFLRPQQSRMTTNLIASACDPNSRTCLSATCLIWNSCCEGIHNTIVPYLSCHNTIVSQSTSNLGQHPQYRDASTGTNTASKQGFQYQCRYCGKKRAIIIDCKKMFINRTVEMEILQVIDLSSWTEASLSDKTSMAATWHQAFSTHGLVGAM